MSMMQVVSQANPSQFGSVVDCQLQGLHAGHEAGHLYSPALMVRLVSQCEQLHDALHFAVLNSVSSISSAGLGLAEMNLDFRARLRQVCYKPPPLYWYW